MTATSQNYELWDTNKFLGVFREIKPDPQYWTQFFGNEILSEDEWIDFEKMPIKGRKIAPFVLPLARGASVYSDSSASYRFKPGYTKVEDRIDPLMPLQRRVGIDANASQPMPKLSPMQRVALIKAAITADHMSAVNRTFNFMSAIALRDGKITLSGKNYPTTLVDFQRAANHTITLGAGSRFGEAGVSILDFFQLVIDRMTTSAFGALPTRATMGGGVWNVMRKDADLLKFLDLTLRDNGNVRIERTLVNGADLVFKVGELFIGGGSGQSIELWVDNSTYINAESGVEERFIGAHQILFTGSPESINGFQVFGRIIDPDANYDPMRIFPKNWSEGGELRTEFISHKSAPLFVPLNANATLLANVIAP